MKQNKILRDTSGKNKLKFIVRQMRFSKSIKRETILILFALKTVFSISIIINNYTYQEDSFTYQTRLKQEKDEYWKNCQPKSENEFRTYLIEH